MRRPHLERMAEAILRKRCPHMFIGRWRIGWQDTLGLMALAMDGPYNAYQELTYLIGEQLPCDPATEFLPHDCGDSNCKWYDVCKHICLAGQANKKPPEGGSE